MLGKTPPEHNPGGIGVVSLDPPVDARKLTPRVGPDAYRRNLATFVKITRDNGIGLIFLRLGDNPTEKDYFDAGLAAREAGRYADAIEALRIAAKKHGITVVDAASVLDTAHLDVRHPDENGHKKAGQLLEAPIRALVEKESAL